MTITGAQAAQTAAAISAEVAKRLAPAKLANLQTNADQIALHLKKNNLEWNADSVLTAVWALHEKGLILWEVDPVPPPLPKPKTLEQRDAEFRAKEEQRILREKIANSKPFDQTAKLAAAKAAEDEAKRQETAKNALNSLILDYTVNGLPGRIDDTKTEAGRAALRGIKINRNGKVDWVLTFKVVQAAYNNDTPAEIIRTAEKAIENYKTHDEQEKMRVRQEERRSGR